MLSPPSHLLPSPQIRGERAEPLPDALSGALNSCRCCGVASYVRTDQRHSVVINLTDTRIALLGAVDTRSRMIEPEEERQQQQQQQQQEEEEGQAGAVAADDTADASRSASAAHKSVPPPSPAASASAASPTNSSPTTGDSSSTPCSAAAPATTTAAAAATPPPSRYNAPLSRRTHAKSRLGCFTCKRRRVKCNEGRPVCSSCRRLGLRCEYPPQQPATAAEGVGTLIASSANPSAYASSSSSSGGPQATIPMLTLQDLRFYHQFLTVGFPALPLKADFIWPLCAAMSHEVRQRRIPRVFFREVSLTVAVRLPRPRPPRPRCIAPLATRPRLPRVPAPGAAAPHHRHPWRQRQARPAAAYGPGGRCPLRGRHVSRRADQSASGAGGHVRVSEHVAWGEPD